MVVMTKTLAEAGTPVAAPPHLEKVVRRGDDEKD
jgi:hypothetical protein